jgi:predicted glycoside hydrolase/deacetylase ChbG (UPF0249 family)
MPPTDDRRPLLIVNADDYGLTVGVSRAILHAHRQGVLTSTSLLALAPGFASTVAWLDDVPDLGTGAHLAAVGEDPPLLSATEIPTLVDRRGRLHESWRRFLPLMAAHRIDPADLRREFTAQIEAMRAAGRVLDHLDTHQNIHLWPAVREVVLELGERFGVRSIRVTRSAARGPVGLTVRRLARDLERRCAELGWTYPAAATGLDEAGTLHFDAMMAAVDHLATGRPTSAELATHPGEAHDPDRDRYRWGYRWEEELAALCEPAVRHAVDAGGFRLGRFADLDTGPVTT